MFGRRKQQQLLDTGTSAPAVLLAKKKGAWAQGSPGAGVGDEHYKVTARIEPADGPPFEATFKDHEGDALGIAVGDRFVVRYDPADHSNVIIDGQASYQARMAALDAQQAAADHASGEVAADPIDKLKELADLRDRGALTDAEFEAQKARLLGSS